MASKRRKLTKNLKLYKVDGEIVSKSVFEEKRDDFIKVSGTSGQTDKAFFKKGGVRVFKKDGTFTSLGRKAFEKTMKNLKVDPVEWDLEERNFKRAFGSPTDLKSKKFMSMLQDDKLTKLIYNMGYDPTDKGVWEKIGVSEEAWYNQENWRDGGFYSGGQAYRIVFDYDSGSRLEPVLFI